VNLEQPIAEYIGNPQLEDGHTRIANELLDAIIRFDFGKRHYKVVLFVLRKTYGWNKKADVMSLSQILDGTGLSRAHSCESINDLVQMKVLLKQEHRNGQLIEINKKYGEWKVFPKKEHVPKTGTKVFPKRESAVPETGTTKDKPKNNTKRQSMSGKPDSVKAQAIEVLQFLNTKASRNYRPTESNLKFIFARFKEGYSLIDCKQVIAKKSREWMPDDKMREYLRPATLFNCEKFNQYIGEIVEEA
jgi:phage replication O-like protein O